MASFWQKLALIDLERMMDSVLADWMLI